MTAHDPLRSFHLSPIQSAMINYRLPWFTLFGGPILVFLSYAIPMPRLVEQSIMLAGGLLLLDGGLGFRVLPSLTPHASYPDDWREIERRLYVGGPGKLRFTLATAACTALAIATANLGEGDWQIWFMVVAMAGWSLVWGAASLKAVRDTLANDH
jgi:hypothetical protein